LKTTHFQSRNGLIQKNSSKMEIYRQQGQWNTFLQLRIAENIWFGDRDTDLDMMAKV
jgi:hypothetical protein